MSDWHPQVVKLGKIGKHPNADSLSITQVKLPGGSGGYPCIFKTGEFQPGDLAFYVPVDSIVDLSKPWFSWLKDKRIKALRLRGIFSMGLLIPAISGYTSSDLSFYGVSKYEPPMPKHISGNEDPEAREINLYGTVPVYDIEGARNFAHILQENEEVWITEKIHGTNARFMWDEERNRLFCGSRQRWVLNGVWNEAASLFKLHDKLKAHPRKVFFGEIYGQKIQDLHYGKLGNDIGLAIFDVLDLNSRTYLCPADLIKLCNELDLRPPFGFYWGPWHQSLLSLAEGESKVHFLNQLVDCKKNHSPGIKTPHVREGIVIKPTTERYDPQVGRVFLKMAGEGYLLRKEGKSPYSFDGVKK